METMLRGLLDDLIVFLPFALVIMVFLPFALTIGVLTDVFVKLFAG
jgi:hypothetical protein